MGDLKEIPQDVWARAAASVPDYVNKSIVEAIARAILEDRRAQADELDRLHCRMGRKWDSLPPDVKDIALAACTLEDGASYDDTHVECAARAVIAERERAADALTSLITERDEARTLVAEANNSLYGSQGYFHSLNGGAFDKYHLATGIENLKSNSRKEWRRAEAAEAQLKAAREALSSIAVGKMTASDAAYVARTALSPDTNKGDGV